MALIRDLVLQLAVWLAAGAATAVPTDTLAQSPPNPEYQLKAVFLFNFLYCWNDLFAPLLYVGADPASYTVSLGLSEFRSSRHVDYELMMAACVLFTLPVTILFFLAQRAFVEGVTVTGVKG